MLQVFVILTLLTQHIFFIYLLLIHVYPFKYFWWFRLLHYNTLDITRVFYVDYVKVSSELHCNPFLSVTVAIYSHTFDTTGELRCLRVFHFHIIAATNVVHSHTFNLPVVFRFNTFDATCVLPSRPLMFKVNFISILFIWKVCFFLVLFVTGALYLIVILLMYQMNLNRILSII